MTALIRSEIRRLTSRRLSVVLLLIVSWVVLVVGVAVFVRSVDLDYADAVPIASRIAAQPLFSLSVVLAASFFGAEWACGAMTTLLTWEPRRGRVLGAKLAAATIVVAVSTVLVMLFIALVLLPSGIAHGTTAGLDASWFVDYAGVLFRTAALSAMGAALGIGLAGIMRNSAGPVATWLVFEFLVSQLIVLWRPGWFRWLPGANVQQFLGGHDDFGVSINGTALFGSFSGLRAGVVLALYAGGLVAVSYGAFRTRDVT